MNYQVIITANGANTRMRAITDLPKFSLFYKNDRILEWLLGMFPTAKVLTHYEIPYIDQSKIIKCLPSASRKETLANLKGMENVLIVDCDIIPILPSGFDIPEPTKDMNISGDIVFWKHSDNSKTEAIPSGLYFIKSIDKLLTKMQNDSIPFSHFHPLAYLNTIHLGTIKEYYDAVLGE